MPEHSMHFIRSYHTVLLWYAAETLDLRPVIITDYVLESSDADTGGSTSCRRNTATEHCREINSSSAGARPF